MKAFLASVVATVAIAILAAVVLESLDSSSTTEFSTSNARPPAPQSD